MPSTKAKNRKMEKKKLAETNKRLKKVMAKAEVKDGYRSKELIIKDEDDGFDGNLRIIGTETDQKKFKSELKDKVFQLSAFDHLVRKRKMDIDVETNQKRKCTRQTTPSDLFLDANYERIHAQVAEQAKDLHAVRYLMGNEPEDEPEDEFEDESEAIKTED